MKTPLEQLEFWIEQYQRINGTPSLKEIKGQIDLLKDCEAGQHETIVIGETQPAPRGTGKEIGKLVLHDIEKRIEKGVDTYGEPLKAHNGRNALLDAYEEALDLAIYLRQVIEESQ